MNTKDCIDTYVLHIYYNECLIIDDYGTSSQISETTGFISKRNQDWGQYMGRTDTNQSLCIHTLLFYNYYMIMFILLFDID